MKALAIGASALFGLLLFGAFAIVALVVVAAGGAGSASAAVTASNPSEEAITDIPPLMLSLFVHEATQCPGLPWTVMAGISKVESDHGRFGGAGLGSDGTIRPPIIGIPLDGTNGTARIPDSDGGRWDHDTVWDRAVGPFQFIPSSWRIFGADGNNDGVADPNNVYDAIGAMRRHLCPDGQTADIESTIFSYNRSHDYVALVLDWASRYTGPLTASATPVAGYALPVASELVTATALTRPHHTYPAWDIGVPVGTPVYSMVGGTVATARTTAIYPDDPSRCGTTIVVAGVDGATYTYCHLSALAVAQGQVIGAGTLLGLSGGQPGTRGAGRTTGPHLHLGIRVGGAGVCPQPLLLAIHRQTPVSPVIAPTAGCVTGLPATDWATWLDQLNLTPPQGEEHADKQPDS